jgi:hypothetical protein
MFSSMLQEVLQLIKKNSKVKLLLTVWINFTEIATEKYYVVGAV